MTSMVRRSFVTGASAALLSAGTGRRAFAAAPGFKTVKPGVITIANSGEMPMISVEDGKLIGCDAGPVTS